jgi:hypothetical protein
MAIAAIVVGGLELVGYLAFFVLGAGSFSFAAV